MCIHGQLNAPYVLLRIHVTLILALNKHSTSRRAEINKCRYILMREYGIPSSHLLFANVKAHRLEQ